MIGAIGLGGSAVIYSLWGGPKKQSQQGTRGSGGGKQETVGESPPEPREENKTTQAAAEKTAEAKSQGQETKRTKPELQDIPPSQADEVCHLPKVDLRVFQLCSSECTYQKANGFAIK